MKLSTRSKYGMRLMIEFAAHYGKGPVLLKDAAKRQEISEKYLSQIVIPLTAKGIVSSSRGTPRGYSLTRKPEDLTVFEVVEILEGSLSPVGAFKKGKVLPVTATYVNQLVWSKLEKAIKDSLSKITFQDILNGIHGFNKNNYTYTI
jgi:Rrf2 family transcriptional regulator, cysteine metabolism repressor